MIEPDGRERAVVTGAVDSAGPIGKPVKSDRALANTILVTGPSRSGKSEWAERLAHESAREVVYLATARPNADDAEWSERIARHRARRPAHWRTCCVPVELAREIRIRGGDDGVCLLVDALGTWVANLLESGDEEWDARVADLLEALAGSASLVILVGEETGWGVVPAYPLGRLFRDRLGGLLRRLGPRCRSSYLVTSGHAIDLRLLGTPID